MQHSAARLGFTIVVIDLLLEHLNETKAEPKALFVQTVNGRKNEASEEVSLPLASLLKGLKCLPDLNISLLRMQGSENWDKSHCNWAEKPVNVTMLQVAWKENVSMWGVKEVLIPEELWQEFFPRIPREIRTALHLHGHA